VRLVLRLEQRISTGESAAGDQILARLDRAVTSGTVLLPKGTRVLGRIRRLEQHYSSPPSILVGLQFLEVEAKDGGVMFNAHLTGPQATSDLMIVGRNGPEIELGSAGLNIEDDGTSTGVGTFRVPGKNLRLQRGFRMLWETH
jgi:hypothetical protein